MFAHPAARATRSAGQAVPILDVWLGAMVPKRWAKRAVTRNAIRRQIYSVGSLFEVDLGVAAHVVRLRSGIDRRSFHSCSSDRLKAVIRDELNMLFAAALPHAKSTPSMPISR